MTGYTPEPNYYGRQLIRMVKQLREQTGMTQEEAGTRAHIELKKLSRMEIRQLPTYHELLMLLDVYGEPSSDWEPYLELWELARKRAWWRDYGLKDCRYVRMEDEAAKKYEFAIGYLPTLVQTEEYAREVFTNTGEYRSDKTISTLMEIRTHQQSRIYAEQRPLALHALIYEPVLRHGVNRAQITRLVEMADLPHVTIQVVPQTNKLHEGLAGPLILLSFDDRHEPDIAFTESLLGLVQSQDNDQVSRVQRVLDHIKSTAMSPEQTLAYIKGML